MNLLNGKIPFSKTSTTALLLCNGLREIGGNVPTDKLAQKFEVHPTYFSKSSKSSYRKAIDVLLENGFITKFRNHKTINYRILRPIEDVESFFSHWKPAERNPENVSVLKPRNIAENKQEIKENINKLKIEMQNCTIEINFK